MDYNLLSGLENLDRVWQRVSGAQQIAEPEKKPPPALKSSDADKLKLFIEGEREAALFYSALAQKCGARDRQVLLGIAAEEGGHMRRLQLEYFLLTGDSHAPPKSCPVAGGILSSLRRAYIDERRSRQGYLEAAEETESRDLSELYTELAMDEAVHAGTLRRMIERALCE